MRSVESRPLIWKVAANAATLSTVGCARMIRLLIFISLVLCSPALSEAQSAHFHHLHLNTTDPAGAIKFFTSKFDCEEGRFLDQQAVWTQQSWLLFNKVP